MAKPTTLQKISKKDQILSLYTAGTYNVAELSALTGARPSYVAAVLRDAKAIRGYFDLYTTTNEPMNIYSRLFMNRLGFRTVGIAQRSVQYLDRVYRYFAAIKDRAGQHHTLVMALTMFNRARWSKKEEQAAIFRDWLIAHLTSQPNFSPPSQQLAHHS